MVGPDFTQPTSDVEPAWTETAPETTARAGTAPDPRWWETFNDPVLSNLIELAHRNNPTLQQAGVAVLQARAQLGIAQGQIYPQQQEVAGELKYYRLDTDTFSRFGFPEQNLYIDQIALQATWEIDFWGKYRRGIESDEAALRSQIAAYDDALISLSADVANNYINIRTLQQQLRVAAANVEAQAENLRIAQASFELGATSLLDVFQAQTQLAQTQSQVPDLQNSLAQTKYALAVELGETPDKIDALLGPARPLPEVPSLIALGIPHDLLRRRPDIREAEATAAAQSAAIGEAEANLYPSFSLAGTFGFGSSNVGSSSLTDIFMWDSRSLNLGASFVFPIFNYGRLINQVRVQDAVFQQAVLNYQNTVLTAQQEVEDGLSSLATSEQAVALLQEATNASQQSTNLSLVQYKTGQTDYTTVLSAASTEYEVEDSLVQAQGNVLLSVVSIYRALGGGWQVRDGIGFVSDEIQHEMEERTDWGDMINEVEEIDINQEKAE
jgi:NodT family efflux transporter outer membrane factor (OMF) lipoprotein